MKLEKEKQQQVKHSQIFNSTQQIQIILIYQLIHKGAFNG